MRIREILEPWTSKCPSLSARPRAGQRLWSKRRYRFFRYDLRFADGAQVHDLDGTDFDRRLQGVRYPADLNSTRIGAQGTCPDEGVGQWVDYPYGRPLSS